MIHKGLTNVLRSCYSIITNLELGDKHIIPFINVETHPKSLWIQFSACSRQILTKPVCFNCGFNQIAIIEKKPQPL
jgi:hypothetical protein